MRVANLWRHPVKSLQGEAVDNTEVDRDGLRGDRVWGIRDEATGRILTGRREPRLLLASASLDEGGPVVHLPTGETCRGAGPGTDATLSRWLDANVSLVPAASQPPGSAEFFADPTDDTSTALEWTMPLGRFVDAMPVLVLTTASLATGKTLYPDGDWNPRRFRPNVLIDTDGDGWIEDAWCDRTIQIGDVEFDAVQPCVRCTMVTRPQPDLGRDIDIYKTLARHHEGTIGVWATIRTPGTLRVGDAVRVIDQPDVVRP